MANLPPARWADFVASGELDDLTPEQVEIAKQKYVDKYGDAIIADAATQHGLDPATYRKQVKQESNFKVDALSKAGARGLTQFMPATAKEVGVDVNDPDSSIYGGAKYQRQLLDQFGGDLTKATAAYNAGPGRVQKAVQQYGDQWPNAVPRETQGYIKRILGTPEQQPQAQQLQQPTKPVSLTWEDFEQSEDYQSLTPDKQAIAKRKFTEKYGATGLGQLLETLTPDRAPGFTGPPNPQPFEAEEPKAPSRTWYEEILPVPVRGTSQFLDMAANAGRVDPAQVRQDIELVTGRLRPEDIQTTQAQVGPAEPSMPWFPGMNLEAPPAGPSQLAHNVGQVQQAGRAFTAKHPEWFAMSKEAQESEIRKALTEGGASAVTSVLAMAPGMALGGVPGMAASGGAIFGFSEYQAADDEIKAFNAANPKDAIPPEIAAQIRLLRGGSEMGFEFFSDLIGGKLLGLDKLSPITKETILRTALTPGVMKTMGRMAGVVATEVPSEMGTAATQSYADSLASPTITPEQKQQMEDSFNNGTKWPDLPPDFAAGKPGPWEAAKQAVGPSVVASLLLGTLGAGVSRAQHQSILNALADADTPEAQRAQAAGVVAESIKDKATRQQWEEAADEAIRGKQPINTEEPIGNFKKTQATPPPGAEAGPQAQSGPEAQQAPPPEPEPEAEDDAPFGPWEDVVKDPLYAKLSPDARKTLRKEWEKRRDAREKAKAAAAEKTPKGPVYETTGREIYPDAPRLGYQQQEAQTQPSPQDILAKQFQETGKKPSISKVSKDFNLSMRAADKLIRDMEAQGLFATKPKEEEAPTLGKGQPVEEEEFTLGEGQPEQAPVFTMGTPQEDMPSAAATASSGKDQAVTRPSPTTGGVAGAPRAPQQVSAGEEQRPTLKEGALTVGDEGVRGGTAPSPQTPIRLTDVVEEESPLREMPEVEQPKEAVSDESPQPRPQAQIAGQAPVQPQITAQAGGGVPVPVRTDAKQANESETANAPITPATIHALADEKGIKWDNDDKFAKFTKGITGKEHLDDMDVEELLQVKDAIERGERPQKHEYSTTQVNLGPAEAKRVKDLAATIADEDLAEEGREETPHVTVKFGIDGDDAEAVRKLLDNEPPISVRLGKTSVFPADDERNSDVIKVDVSSPDLERLNKKITDAIPGKEDTRPYSPHVTLGYVKPGLGKKYEGRTDLEGQEITVDTIAFNDRQGKTTEIPLTGQRSPAPSPSQAESPTQGFPPLPESGASQAPEQPDPLLAIAQSVASGKKPMMPKDRGAMRTALGMDTMVEGKPVKSLGDKALARAYANREFVNAARKKQAPVAEPQAETKVARKKIWEVPFLQWKEKGGYRRQLEERIEENKGTSWISYVEVVRALPQGRRRWEAYNLEGQLLTTGESISGPSSVGGKLLRRKDKYRGVNNALFTLPEKQTFSLEWYRKELDNFDRENHKEQVQFALKEGEAVPAEVLADYPDLQPTPQKELKPPTPGPIESIARSPGTFEVGSVVEYFGPTTKYLEKGKRYEVFGHQGNSVTLSEIGQGRYGVHPPVDPNLINEVPQPTPQETPNEEQEVRPQEDAATQEGVLADASDEYRAAYKKSGEAIKRYEAKRDAYRQRKIDEQEFLEAQAEYKASQEEFDRAHAKEQAAPQPPGALTPEVESAPLPQEEGKPPGPTIDMTLGKVPQLKEDPILVRAAVQKISGRRFGPNRGLSIAFNRNRIIQELGEGTELSDEALAYKYLQAVGRLPDTTDIVEQEPSTQNNSKLPPADSASPPASPAPEPTPTPTEPASGAGATAKPDDDLLAVAQAMVARKEPVKQALLHAEKMRQVLGPDARYTGPKASVNGVLLKYIGPRDVAEEYIKRFGGQRAEAKPQEQPTAPPPPVEEPQPTPQPEPQPQPTPQPEKPTSTYGKSNKVFTEDAAAKARALLKKKLSQVNTGLDPEIMQAGLTLAGYHIEAGARKFADYVKAMVEDLGEVARPYLRGWYENVRYYPGFDNTGMSTDAEIAAEEQAPVVDSAKEGVQLGQEDQPDVEPTTEREPDRESASGPGTQDVPGVTADEPTPTVRDREGDRAARDAGSLSGAAVDDHPAEDGPNVPGISAGTEDGQPSGAGTSDSGGGRSLTAGRGAGSGNYVIRPGGLTREGSWRDTARRNLDIIDLAKRLESEGRPATPEEQALLVKYVGFGASDIRNNLFPTNPYVRPAWQDLADRAQELLTDEERKTLLRSTQYAHYTSEAVIRSIYAGLERMGFPGGKVLEPGMGIGHFAGLMPESMSNTSTYTGIEFDHLTAAIAKALYPGDTILRQDYTQAKLPNDFFDAAIGNPPFASTRILTDPAYRKQRFMLHDYFFAKTIDKVRPGGLLVFVTSKGTMDKIDDKARKYLADRADLLGAVRLPQTAFQENAGTEVVTDVLFLRKREPGQERAGESWLGKATVTTPEGDTEVNEYFAAHPEMVLGTHSLQGSHHKENDYTVLPREGEDIEQAFRRAVERLPEKVYSPLRSTPDQVVNTTIERDFNPKIRKEGGVYVADNGTLMVVDKGSGVPLTVPDKDIPWMKDYVGLRDAIKTAQMDQLKDGDWEASLKELNKSYTAFVKKHGNILDFTLIEHKEKGEDGEVEITLERRPKNKSRFKHDVESPLVMALERITEDNKIVKGPFLTGRSLKKPTRPEITSPQDAMAVVLDEQGKLDLPAIATLLDSTTEKVIEDLGDLIYQSPSGEWQTADEYLSGYVKDKLAEAELAARTDRRYERNVKALAAVQPKPLAPRDITVHLGASWVDPRYVREFAEEVLGESTPIRYNPDANVWSLGAGRSQSGRGAGKEWGTVHRSPTEILDAVLNSRPIKIQVTQGSGANRETVTLVDETAAANEIAKKMKQEFQAWVWKNADRAKDLTDLYNEKRNNIAPRSFDGSHLSMPGASLLFKLYPHQKRAIWRIIQTGNTYLAHAVGAGKTFIMIAAGMEMKRLGMIRKPMYVVPRHMLGQFANEFLELYPSANIMVADEEAFHTDNRKQFVARAALNDPDAIIFTQPAFQLLSMKPENYQRVVDEFIDELKEALADVPKDERATRSRLESQIEQLEQRVAAKYNANRDKVVDFEDMGADFIFVDEAHSVRKLDFSTNRKVKGISPAGSARAIDMYAKTRWLDQQRPGRSFVFASGTPVTNTMAELYTIQKFFSFDVMKSEDLGAFDAWANEYGETETKLEMNAAGNYEMVERFSKFTNLPRLRKRIGQFMDILTFNQLKGLLTIPTIKGGERQIVVVPRSEALAAYQRTLEARIQAIRARKGPPSPGDDIMLSVITDGRLANIDLRFVDPTAENDPNSKLNTMADDIIEVYKRTKETEYVDPDGKAYPTKGSGQIVFSVSGFGEQVAQSRGFNGRAWLMKRLKEGGIPEREVGWIADYGTAAKKAELFADMRSGKKKIMIGSPQNMGTGVNAQKRLYKLQFLDPPWYPADVEQPMGRILRQGNLNPEVEISAYAVKASYDATMWGLIARKSSFIEQFFSGDDSLQTMEDLSETSQYEMASALASGDQRVIQLAGLNGDIERLTRLRNAHEQDQRQLVSDLSWQQRQVEWQTTNKKNYEEAIAKAPMILSRNFTGSTGTKSFDNREEFGEALVSTAKVIIHDLEKEALAKDKRDGVAWRTIGKLDGKHNILLSSSVRSGAHFSLEVTKPIDQDWDANPLLFGSGSSSGLVTKMVNFVNGLERQKSQVEDEIETAKRRIAEIRSKMGAPFAYEQELFEKIAQAAQLTNELAASGEDQPDISPFTEIDFTSPYLFADNPQELEPEESQATPETAPESTNPLANERGAVVIPEAVVRKVRALIAKAQQIIDKKRPLTGADRREMSEALGEQGKSLPQRAMDFVREFIRLAKAMLSSERGSISTKPLDESPSQAAESPNQTGIRAGLKSTFGTERQQMEAQLGKERGDAAFDLFRHYRATSDVQQADIDQILSQKLTNDDTWRTLKKIFLGSNRMASEASSFLRRTNWGKRFGIAGDQLTTLFRTVEAIRELDADGNPVFGTKIYKKDPVTKETVKDAAGNPVELRDRYTAEQGQKLWDSLSARGKEAAKFWVQERDVLKAEFGIMSDVEGYIHHFWDRGFFKGLSSLLKRVSFARMRLKGKTASSRKVRTEAQGFVEDFERAVAKGWGELIEERAWNDMMKRLIPLITDPIDPDVGLHDGWVRIEKSEATRRGRYISQLAGGRQIPAPLWNDLVRYVEPVAEAVGMSQTLRQVGRYMAGNLMTSTATMVRNAVGSALQYSTYVVDSFAHGLITGQFRPFVRTLLAPLEILRPSVWEQISPELLGSRSNLLTQFEGKGWADQVNKVLLFPIGAIDNALKRAIAVSELRARNIPLDRDEVLANEKAFADMRHAVDTWGLDYENIPSGMKKFKEKPWANFVLPFATYPYKIAQMMGHYLAAIPAMVSPSMRSEMDVDSRFKMNPNSSVSPQTREITARLLTMGMILGAIAFGADDDDEKVGPWVEGMPFNWDKAGRLKTGETPEGKERYSYVADQPWFNLYMLLRSGWRAFTKDEPFLHDATVVAGRSIPGGGLLWQGAMLAHDVYQGDYKNRPAGPAAARLVKPFVPFGRMTEAIKESGVPGLVTKEPEPLTKSTTFTQELAEAMPFPVPESVTGVREMVTDPATGKAVIKNPTLQQQKFWLGWNIAEIDPKVVEKARDKMAASAKKSLDKIMTPPLPKNWDDIGEVLKKLNDARTVDDLDKAFANYKNLAPDKAAKVQEKVNRSRIVIERKMKRRFDRAKERAAQ